MISLIANAFKLETCLFDSFLNFVGSGSARDRHGFCAKIDLGCGHALDFAHGFLDGSLAVVAVHTLNGVGRRAFNGLLFLEFVKEFHT